MINKDDQFYRCSLNNREIFKAPHLIMKQSHRKGRFLLQFWIMMPYSIIVCWVFQAMKEY